MINYLLAIIIGVLSSFVASIIFLLCLSKIKPNIVISDKIAKNKDSTGNINYKIKFINTTSRSIINVKAELKIITLTAMPGGMIEQNKTIPLINNEIMQISKFDLKDKNAEYAYRLTTNENIEELWKDDEHSFLRFIISAKDSLSGLGKVFYKDYYVEKNSIEEGGFEFGNSFNIK